MDAEDNSSALPSYPEMIMAAITALNEDDGSSKTAISEYMESHYKDLSSTHATLLSNNLNKMKEGGELQLVNNNYKKADPSTASKKRGRGRPPKAKDPVPAGSPVSSPRPRGRPPKAKDPLTAAASKVSGGTPKRRGRPPLKAKMVADKKDEAPKDPAPASVASPQTASAKRGRGRPPKVKS